MRFRFTTSLTTGLVLLAGITQVRAQQESSVCTNDLVAVAELLRKDYAGYKVAESTIGLSQVESAYKDARASTSGKIGATCDEAIRSYLEVFRDGHLAMHSDHSPAVDMPPPLFYKNRTPSIQKLSKDEMLLRVPSFAVGYAKELSGLLTEHESELRACKTLILDVRGNSGGSDTVWADLIKPIYAEPLDRGGIKWLATPGNADALDAQLNQYRNTISKSMCKTMDAIVAGMRAAKPGSFVQLGPVYGPKWTLPEVWKSPERVAILVDGFCTSGCENFMVAATQSSKVTIYGQKTYGAIDFQNVRMTALPSKERQIMFGMSVTDRTLTQNKRNLGVEPDYPLSAELLRDVDGAVQRVRALVNAQG